MCTGIEIAMIASAATGLGSAAGVFGEEAKTGKKIEYEAQAPKYQTDFAEKFYKYLQGQIGVGATPYGGQVAAPYQNPFTQGAFGAMKASPYGSMMGNMPMGGTPFVPPQAPPQVGSGRGVPQPPGQVPPQRPMQRPRERGRGGRGVPFQR